jgi:hypothetical protein
VEVAQPVVRDNIMTALSGFERLLLLLGLLLVFAYAVVRIYSVVYARATVREFWRNQAATLNRPGNLLQQNLGISDFRLWSSRVRGSSSAGLEQSSDAW